MTKRSRALIMMDYKFRITNKTTGAFIYRIAFENNYYTAKLFYYGDYAAHKAEQDIRPNLTTVTITPKADNLLLVVNRNSVMIKDPELQFIDPDYVVDLTGRLRIAAESAKELRRFLQEHIYQYTKGETTRWNS